MGFQAPYATGFLFLIAIVAFGFAYWTYRGNKFDPPWRVLLPVLRFFSLFILGALLLNPYISSRSTQTERPVLIWLQDASESILSQGDSAFYKQEYPALLNQSLSELKERYDVLLWPFDAEIHSGGFEGFSGNRSNPVGAMTGISRRYAHRNVGAVVLATDGIVNLGRPLQTGDLKSKAPVYVLGMGDSTHYPDLLVDRVLHNPVAYRGNVFPIEAELSAVATNLSRSEVKLYMNGQLLDSKYTEWKNGRALVHFDVVADSVGVMDFSIVVQSLQEENNTSNNRERFTIEILENRKEVLLVFEAPHPDIATLLLPFVQNAAFEVEQVQGKDWRTDRALKADLVIFHGFVPDKPAYDALLRGGKAIAAVTLNGAQLSAWRNLGNPWNELHQTERMADLYPTWNSDFTLFRIDEAWGETMNEAPPLRALMHSESNNGIWQSLYTSRVGRIETQTPILAVAEWEGRRHLWLNGEGWWRARAYTYSQHGNAQAFDEGMAQMYRWLFATGSTERLQVYYPDQIDRGSPFTIDAVVLDAALEPYSGAAVQLTVQPPDGAGESRQHTLSQTLKGRYSVETEYEEAGFYPFVMEARLGSETLKKTGRFTVREWNWESGDTRARFAELTTLAKNNRGTFHAARDINQIVNDLLKDDRPKSILHERESRHSLLEEWWIYVLILALLTTEWMVRKREGRV